MSEITTFYNMTTLADDFFRDNRDFFEKIMGLNIGVGETLEKEYFKISRDEDDIVSFRRNELSPEFVIIKNPVRFEIFRASGHEELPETNLWDSKSGINYSCDLNAIRSLAKFVDDFREEIMEL